MTRDRQPPDPDACYWCDLPQRIHAQRWHHQPGWHRWTPPADWLRLARMRERRAHRHASRALARLNPTPGGTAC